MPPPPTSPSIQTPGEALFDLEERAAAFLNATRWTDSKPALREHFFGEGYDARWPLRVLLFEDAADLLSRALDAGFPVEAPVGFAHGSLLCEAALVGAPRCAELLLARGADLTRTNDLGELPVEIAVQEAALDEERIFLLRMLVQAGAALRPEKRFAIERPLGSSALRALGHQWDQIKLDARGAAFVASDCARRLDLVREACGLTSAEFLPSSGTGLVQACLLERIDPAVGSALEALWESTEIRSKLRLTPKRSLPPRV